MHLDLTQGDIKNQIKTLAIPSSIGFFFHTIYNVTDTYFAGLISTQALSALTLSFSIFFMVIAFASGMSEAVTALVGNALGSKDKEYASHITLNSLVFALILTLGVTLTGLASASFLMQVLGANASYLQESLAYINIILYGSIFFVFSFFLNAILNSVGDTKSFRNILIFSSLVNVVLDYWFVLGGLGLEPQGIQGIAFATVLTEFISCIYLFYKVQKTPLLLSEKPFHLDMKVFKELLYQGIPPSANLVLMAGGIFIITYFAAQHGQDVIAAFGVGMRVEQIALMPSIGLNVAVLAIISQNNGAKNYKRIHETLNAAMFYGGVLSFGGLVLLLVAAEPLMELFTKDPQVIHEGVVYIRVEAFILYSFVIIFVHIAMLQGIKKPGFIICISIFRQIVAPFSLLAFFSYLGLGLIWVWLGVAGIVTFSALLTYIYSRKKLAELELCVS
ncbi:MAG TPA: MATE family efflux transporter [Sulfurimonas sp.]|nr:MATE family efflux transporter [Sulfurimonas sp.]